MRASVKIGLAVVALCGAQPAWAHGPGLQTFIIGVQENSPAQWEAQAIVAQGLDAKHEIALDIRPFADEAAMQKALQAGDLDIIQTDFVWVSIERNARGPAVSMVPYSTAAGGVVVDAASGIDSVDDLKGKTIAVAGSATDSSWLILQADYAKATGGKLADDATVSFDTSAAVNELVTNGGTDAALNAWQWNVRAVAAGKVEALPVLGMLTDLGAAEMPPLFGWAFTDAKAKTLKAAFIRFLDASFEANATLASDDSAWDGLKDAMNVGDDDALFAQLRDGYRASIAATYNPSGTGPAKKAYGALAEFGGAELVGAKPAINASTFWRGFRK